MIKALTFLFGLALFGGAHFSTPFASPLAHIKAGKWLVLPDVKLRFLLDDRQSPLLHGGLEMRLAPGFKTYWKNPGDSGVPPRFDFSASQGISDLHMRYPLPHLLDDKAGGSLIGYEEGVIFPFQMMRVAPDEIRLHLKLDFAICGTICIPLSTEMSFDAGIAQSAPSDALHAAFAHSPFPEEGTRQPSDIRLSRLPTGSKPRWQVQVPFSGAAAEMRAFPEAANFISVTAITLAEAGFVTIALEGEAPLGKVPRFNPARLTFGVEGNARDVPLDLDGAEILP